jgi:hypothetical protein
VPRRAIRARGGGAERPGSTAQPLPAPAQPLRGAPALAGSRPRIEYHAPAQEDTCPRDAGAGQAAELAALQQQLNAERAARTTAEMKASWLADKLKAVGERSKQRGHMMVRLLTAAA